MKVTAKGEYATRAVLHLAMQHPEVVSIHQIAKRHRIPVKYLEQILLELKRGGILTSRRGVHGGYLLSRDPDEISVGEVLQIVDSRTIDSPALQQNFACSGDSGCALKQVWTDVRTAVEKIPFETSFADVCANTRTDPPVANISKLGASA
jgi:Rrf2 family protein